MKETPVALRYEQPGCCFDFQLFNSHGKITLVHISRVTAQPLVKRFLIKDSNE